MPDKDKGFFGHLLDAFVDGSAQVIDLNGYLDRLRNKSFSEKVMICEQIVRKYGENDTWNREFGFSLQRRRDAEGEEPYKDVLKAMLVARANISRE